jgi:hypothetical protein
MARHTFGLAVGVLAVLAVGSVFAGPLKVRTLGTKSQETIMCPDCKSKVSCAQVGDYTIGLVVDQDNAKLGTGKLIVHVQDKTKKPVEGAKVSVALSMPKHEHAAKPVDLKGGKHGEYSTGIQHLGMPGDYRADVAVVVNGDTVKQAFSFTK